MVLKKYEEALFSYDRALEVDADNYMILFNRGNVLFHLKMYKEAVTSYSKALEINPDDEDAWNNRNVALRNLGMDE